MAPFNAPINGAITDALNVNLTSERADINKPRVVDISFTTANMPGDCAWGVRTVYLAGPNAVIVQIYGIDKNGIEAGLWSNCYNKTSWTGWKRF